MKLNLSIAGLPLHTQISVIRFGLAAKKYYTSPSGRDPLTRHVDQFVELEYTKAKKFLLACTDPELKEILDQIDSATLLDKLQDAKDSTKTAAYNRMVEIEKQIAALVSKP